VVCGAVACPGERDRWDAHGIVYDVQVELGQVLIEHDEVPGLMSAMTMSFDVPDPRVLAKLSKGQVIDFVIDTRDRGYRLVSFEVVGEATEEDGWVRFGDALVLAAPAPEFALTDQEGQPFGLADLAGRGALVDFVFTSCPGPCPILTSNHVAAQRALSAESQPKIHFVSISLDPANDDPAAMREYALERGANLAHWSFLTGPVEEVSALISAFGVGSVRAEDGTIEHMLITFLVDGKGRIVKRYFGTQHDPKAIAADLETLADDT
jgi:protein SCO1/2